MKGKTMNETGLQLKYFVLSPTKQDAYGIASRKAMAAYAKAIHKENPELTEDLFAWLKTLDPVGDLSEEVSRWMDRESR